MNHNAPLRGVARPRTGSAGFSLIELMVAMLLGFLVVAAAGGVFLSNKRVYASSETIGRIQENTRVAFELMSRDVREAGGNPCGSANVPVNILEGANDIYWDRFGEGLTGYDAGDTLPMTATGTATAQRVAGTDAIEVHSALDGGVRVVEHDGPSANLQVTSITGFVDGDILLVCNISQSFIFQVTGFSAAGGGVAIQHNAGGGSSLNCSQTFQVFDGDADTDCSPGASSAVDYCFTEVAAGNPQCDFGSLSPAYVVRPGSIQWYVGNNARGGTSLYRSVVVNRTGTATPNVELARDEIVEGVQGLALTYLEQGENAYSNAAGVADWSRVIAARIELVMTGAEGALGGGEIEGTDGAVLTRTVAHVVSLRNREGTL